MITNIWLVYFVAGTCMHVVGSMVIFDDMTHGLYLLEWKLIIIQLSVLCGGNLGGFIGLIIIWKSDS